jgi:hypothetical protein
VILAAIRAFCPGLADMYAQQAKIRAVSGWNRQRGGMFSLHEFMD